jgi:hypothetical protein
MNTGMLQDKNYLPSKLSRKTKTGILLKCPILEFFISFSSIFFNPKVLDEEIKNIQKLLYFETRIIRL